MAKDVRYVVLNGQSVASPVASTLKWLILAALVCILSLLAWRWVDRNLLHWGIEDSKISYVNEAELLKNLKGFEVVTTKHTYGVSADIDVDKALRAGPTRVGLPGWLAGQDLKVSGEVAVAAGVDLSGLTAEDMEVTAHPGGAHVVVRVPSARILSTEILPGTTDIDISQGIMTRLKTRIGLSERDLRDEATDRLGTVARNAALEKGVLEDAAGETELRLETFLASLPRTGEGQVSYDVQVDRPLD